MSNSIRRLRLSPESSAINLLHDFCVQSVPVDVISLASALGVEVRFEALDGFDGLLIVGKQATFIVVKKDSYGPRGRFTIAHELGHFSLHRNLRSHFTCSTDDLHSFKNEKPLESEANAFASTILLPPAAFDKDVQRLEASLRNVVALSEKYEVSLTCVAISLIRKTQDAAAAVITKDQKIEHCIRSEAFPFYIARSAADPEEALESSNRSYERLIPASYWTNDNRLDNLFEESLYMPNLDRTLTILRVPEDELDLLYEDDSFWG